METKPTLGFSEALDIAKRGTKANPLLHLSLRFLPSRQGRLVVMSRPYFLFLSFCVNGKVPNMFLVWFCICSCICMNKFLLCSM